MKTASILILVILNIGICRASNLQNQADWKFRFTFQRSVQEKLKHHPIKNLKDIDANTYIDEILTEAHQNAVDQNLDPYQLGNIEALGVDTDGYIAGYSNMLREGDAIVIETDTSLTINFTVAMYDVEGHFNWSTPYLGIEYNGDADAQVSKVIAFATLEGPIYEASASVAMECTVLDVVDIGLITVAVHGYDELINIVGQAIVNIIHDWIPWSLNNVCQVIVNEVLASHPFPLPESASFARH